MCRHHKQGIAFTGFVGIAETESQTVFIAACVGDVSDFAFVTVCVPPHLHPPEML